MRCLLLLLSSAFASPPTLQDARALRLDRVELGQLGTLERAGERWGVLQTPTGTVQLGRADQIWVAGVIDLAAEGPVPGGRAPESALKSVGTRPVLVIGTRWSEARPEQKGRRAGTRRVETVSLVEGARRLLQVQREVRAADGFGGHSLGGLKLRKEGGVTLFEAMRQDKLPRRRARCMRPKPYLLRYTLVDGGFQKQDLPRPRGGCR